MDTDTIKLELTKDEIDVMIQSLQFLKRQRMVFQKNDISNAILLKKITDVSCNKNDEIKTCPFCGRLPEPELFSHNSIKQDSWYIFCDCGKVQIQDCETLEECLIEWNERV